MIIRRSPRAVIVRPGKPPIIVTAPAAPIGGGGGVTDHGALTGLADDDHTQYALADGSRGTFATAAQGALADSATQPGDLATVATTGAYSDLSGLPTLGTAAAAATTDFATAAQGALADSATQPGDLATVATTGAYADLSGLPTLGNSSGLDVGTTTGTVAAGDDARLSDDRDPTAHASDHAAAGGDALTGLSSSQMPNVSGSDISATTHTAADADAGLVRSCTNASGCEITFPDTITAGKSGSYYRGSGAGAITWAASGDMVVTPASGNAGATTTGDAPAFLHWYCPATDSVIIWGDLV